MGAFHKWKIILQASDNVASPSPGHTTVQLPTSARAMRLLKHSDSSAWNAGEKTTLKNTGYDWSTKGYAAMSLKQMKFSISSLQPKPPKQSVVRSHASHGCSVHANVDHPWDVHRSNWASSSQRLGLNQCFRGTKNSNKKKPPVSQHSNGK